MQNYLFVEDDSLRMEIIVEEDESNAAKMSFQQLDTLHFELTANVDHDCKLLRKALNQLQQSIKSRAINKQLARFQFKQLKEKLNKFFVQKIEVQSEEQLETISHLCNDTNQLFQLILELYEEQSEIIGDSHNDLFDSQMDILVKKRSSEQVSFIQKKSFVKVSHSIPSVEAEYQHNGLNPLQHYPQNSSQTLNSQSNNIGHNVNQQNSMNYMNGKSSHSRFQLNENLHTNQNKLQTVQGRVTQVSSLSYQNEKNVRNYSNNSYDKMNIDENQQNKLESSTFIQQEEVFINIPKSIHIKQNQFNSFKVFNQSQQLSSQAAVDSDILTANPLIISSKQTSLTFENDVNPSKIKSKANINHNDSNKIQIQTPKTPSLNSDQTPSLNQTQIPSLNLTETPLFNSTQTPQKQQNIDEVKYEETIQRDDVETKKLSKLDNNCKSQINDVKQSTLLKQDLQSKNAINQIGQGFNHQNINQQEQTKINVNKIQEIEKQLDEDFQNMKQLFYDKFIDDLEVERVKLYKKIEVLKNGNYESKEEFESMINNFEKRNEQEIKYFKNVYDQMIECTDYIQEKEGWKQEKNKDGIQIEYKKIPNSKLLALRLQCDNMEMDIQVLCSIIYEIDLYAQWFPFCKLGKNLKTLDKASKVAYLKMDVPFISNREVYIHGIGVNRLYKYGTLLVMARSIDKDLQCQKEVGVDVPTSSKCVRVDIPLFTFVIKPISPQRLSLYAICQLDPHIKLVPDSVINLVTRKFAYYLFEKMLEQNKKFKGSKWEQNMKNSPEFYSWINRECISYFNKNPPSTDESDHKKNKNTKKK